MDDAAETPPPQMETSLDSSQPINFLLLEALRNLNTEQTYGPAT